MWFCSVVSPWPVKDLVFLKTGSSYKAEDFCNYKIKPLQTLKYCLKAVFSIFTWIWFVVLRTFRNDYRLEMDEMSTFHPFHACPYLSCVLAVGLTCEWQGNTDDVLTKPIHEIQSKLWQIKGWLQFPLYKICEISLIHTVSHKLNKWLTAPGLLLSTDCWTWGLWLVHETADVSLACTKFSSSKSPQSSQSSPRSKQTVGICEDEAFLPWVLWFDAAAELFEQTELLVLIWLRSIRWFWLTLTENPGFVHTVEPKQSNFLNFNN